MKVTKCKNIKTETYTTSFDDFMLDIVEDGEYIWSVAICSTDNTYQKRGALCCQNSKCCQSGVSTIKKTPKTLVK